MKLERIRLKRVPGIEPAFEIDNLSPGINVVIGPNGSGKTSFRRAVAATLWPTAHPSKQLEIQSDWTDGDQRLYANRDAGGVEWLVDGRNADAPALPDAHLEQCYTLGVGELMLTDNKTDQTIAREIRVAMSGGYDLREVGENQFALKLRFGGNERKAYDTALNEYKQVCRDQRDLAKDEQRLVELREDANAARVAEQLIPKINDALELNEVLRGLSVTQARLNEFPDSIERVSENDEAFLEPLLENRRAVEEQATEHDRRITAYKKTIEESRLEEQPLAQNEIDAAFTHLRELKNIDGSLKEARRRRSQAAANLEHTTKTLAGGLELDAVPDISAEMLTQAEALLRKSEGERARRVELEQRIVTLSSRKTDEDARILEDATRLLRDWLSTPVPGERAVPGWMLVAAGFVALVGVALAAVFHIFWLLLTGGGVGVALGLLVASRTPNHNSDELSRHAQRFLELNIGTPEGWSANHVRAMLRDLEGRLSEVLFCDAASAEKDEVEALLRKHQTVESDTENEQVAFREKIGIDIGTDLALYDIAARCRQYTEAKAELINVDAEIEQLEVELITPRKAINELLSAYEYNAGTDNAELAAQLNAMQRRLDSYTTTKPQLDEEKSDLSRSQKRLSLLSDQIQEFYAERNLEPEDHPGLKALLAQLPDHAELTGKQSNAIGRLRDLKSRLDANPELLDLDEDALNQRLVAVTEESDGLSEISETIGAILQRVKDATDGTAVELALAKVDTMSDALREAGEKAQIAAAGRFLLDQVDEEHEKMSRPVVLDQAMQHFTAFTHNAFELTITDGGDAGFRARNTSTREFLELAQLSDGTRIQLLLAVRLAFATSSERGSSIPLMLDEALSTSDPERFRAVAEALAVLAANGRQVFYLTSNPADFVAWMATTHDDATTEPALVDLGRIRWDQAAIKNIDELKRPEPPMISKPNGLTPEEYAMTLGVPSALAHAPIESLHLFYLLQDDLPLLHRLLVDFKIDALGKWESFARSGRAETLLPPESCALLNTLCTGAREVQSASSIGRGKPVDGLALEESDAVSETFMPVLRELIHAVGGDAKAMLDSINDPGDDRVKEFRKKNSEKLREFFEEHGYIDARPTLDTADIYARTVEVMAAAIESEVVVKDACLALADRLVAAFEIQRGEEVFD